VFVSQGYEPKIEKCVSEYLAGTRGPSQVICPRVRVRISDLRAFNPILAQQLISDPLRHLRALELACHHLAEDGYATKASKDSNRIKVSLVGPLSASSASPRSLVSSSLGRLVCLEGVTTRVSSSKPKLVKSVHYCPTTNAHHSRTYIDATDSALGLFAIDESGMEIQDKIITMSNNVYPTTDKDKNPLETEFGLSVYKDFQTVCLQEMPERAPIGQLPRSVDLILEHDLVDQIKPGDRVQVMGVYRALMPHGNISITSGTFRTVVLVNHVQVLGRTGASQLQISSENVRDIRALARESSSEILDILGRSIAPSIHGHDFIKKALVLQLLGGVEKNLKNGTHLRGDINILMVGDPSTAKSQLLRTAMNVSPLAISTTGKGSSGVGLTAAVTSDPDTRERRLEAGAMVLADRGLVCVDEFDKMSESDRVSIHEAMEQQTVTIAKAGIHASLNARCSVLAAANPVYGQYDRSKSPQENIGLPDSLLSRFDLLFIVLDKMNTKTDRMIASHVLRGHCYRRPGTGVAPEQPTTSIMEDSEDDSDDDIGPAVNSSSVWQKNHAQFTHSTADDDYETPPQEILNQDFLRKYLHFAKVRITPVLSDEARETIATCYAEMRARQGTRTLPVTARSLETIIRLSSAHAKARLSPVVEAEPDVVNAMDLLRFAMYKDLNMDDEVTQVAEVTDDEITQLDLKPSASKRPRLDPETVSAQIWHELTQAGGELTFDEVLPEIPQSAKMDAITHMLKGGRIMFEDNTLYQV